ATDPQGQIYAIGGRTGSDREPSDIVEVYNPSSGSWSTGTSLPSPMGDPSATRGKDGKIYVLDAATLAIYDPDARSWTTRRALRPAPPRAPGARGAAPPPGRPRPGRGWGPRRPIPRRLRLPAGVEQPRRLDLDAARRPARPGSGIRRCDRPGRPGLCGRRSR